MKTAIRRFISLVLCLLLLTPAAFAEHTYLIPDSNTRHLTEEELWEWDYESLGFIYHEIFARHGFIFNPGGQYYHSEDCVHVQKGETPQATLEQALKAGYRQCPECDAPSELEG